MRVSKSFILHTAGKMIHTREYEIGNALILRANKNNSMWEITDTKNNDLIFEMSGDYDYSDMELAINYSNVDPFANERLLIENIVEESDFSLGEKYYYTHDYKILRHIDGDGHGDISVLHGMIYIQLCYITETMSEGEKSEAVEKAMERLETL